MCTSQTQLSFLLQRAGYAVDMVADGEAALDAALSAPPDAVVLDIMLPGMDGYAVLRALRADARTTRLPVLVLTAKGQSADREVAEAAGADRFVLKPFANAELIAAVQELTG